MVLWEQLLAAGPIDVFSTDAIISFWFTLCISVRGAVPFGDSAMPSIFGVGVDETLCTVPVADVTFSPCLAVRLSA